MKFFLIVVSVILVIYFCVKRGVFRPKVLKIYATLIAALNSAVFKGEGTLSSNNGKLQLYKQNNQQILYFWLDNDDNLLVEWKYKYYQQEMVFKDTVYRNLYSDTDIAMGALCLETLVRKFAEKRDIHIEEVDNKGIPEGMLSEYGITAQQLQNSRDFLRGY